MAFSTNIADQSIEKHSLVVIRPRKRLVDWNIVSGSIYSKSFSLGKVTRVWNEYNNTDGLTEGGSPSLSSGQFYYDQTTETLYVDNPIDPDLNTYPGMTVEFELNISDAPFTGPRDPLNNNSETIDWIPYLKNIPQSQNGSQDTLYGFIPLIQSNLSILNGDGFFNDLLHECSFYLCPVKVYILANPDYEKGVLFSDVQEIFLGFSSGMEYRDDELNISCVDYNTFFDREFSLPVRMNTSQFPLAEPDSVSPGQEWYARRIYGMVDGFRPINIDYNATPATNNNRDWVVRDLENDTDDLAGNLNYTVDHLAANTGTRTYFTDPPAYNIGDWIILNNNSVNYYVEVEDVNRSLKYIDHEPLVRTIIAGDTGTRYDVARVIVMSEDGTIPYWLRPGIDYTLFNNTTLDVSGFVMADNWEAALSFTDNGGIFDPSKNPIYVRAYSSSWVGSYYSSNDVGTLAENSGRSSQAVTILHKIINSSGFDISLIDENTFSAATNQSLGFSVPASHTQINLPTYKSLMSQILSSMLWKLSFVTDGSEIKVGLVEVGPFVGSGDYTADETEHNNFTYKHDYGDVYSDILINYSTKERVIDGGVLGSSVWEFLQGLTTSECFAGKHLHLASKTFSTSILQYDPLEAQVISDRYSFILGDRRGIYSIILGQEFLNSVNLGAEYVLKRERLPGFSFVYGTEQERQLELIEVQKSSQAVSIVLEDQKGIQDNAGDW
jgi:hypothetical protein